MREAGVVGLGSFVLAGKEKLCLIRPKGEALALETLFVAEDVKSQEEIDEAVTATGVRKEELALAKQIIAGLEGTFEPAELRSEYRAQLRELLEAKLEGREIVELRRRRSRTAPVIDLMEALRASVAASQAEHAGREEARSAPQARGRAARLGLTAGSASPVVLGRERSDRGQLRLEQRLVDLAVVDRDVLLDADPDHLVAVDADLLRQLLGRQMIGHVAPLVVARKSPPRSLRRRAGLPTGIFGRQA